MTCRYCGAEMPEGEARCPACGALDPYYTAAPAEAPTENTEPAADVPVDDVPADAPAAEAPAAPQNPYAAPNAGEYRASAQNAPENASGTFAPSDPTAAPAPQKKAKGAALAIVLRLVGGLLIVALVAVGFNFFHQHSSFLSKGETVNLDDLLEAGEDYPLGEFVHVDAPFILDQFATEKSTINGITSGEDTYYYVILKSRIAVAVKAASVDDIAVLDQGADDTYAFLNDELETFDDIPIDGKLVRMTDTEILQYFDEYTDDYGFNDADSTIKAEHYIIDMTAARGENVLFYIIIPLAVIVIAIVIISRVRKAKKKKAAQQQAEMPPMQ